MRLSDDLRWFIVDDELSLSIRDLEIVDHWPPTPELRGDDIAPSDVSIWPHHVRRVRCPVGFYQFSIVWGTGTYSANYPLMFTTLEGGRVRPFSEEPDNVEVMIFEHDGNRAFDGEPIAHVDAERMRELVAGFVATAPDDAARVLDEL